MRPPGPMGPGPIRPPLPPGPLPPPGPMGLGVRPGGPLPPVLVPGSLQFGAPCPRRYRRENTVCVLTG